MTNNYYFTKAISDTFCFVFINTFEYKCNNIAMINKLFTSSQL